MNWDFEILNHLNFVYFDIILRISAFWIVAVVTPGPNFFISLDTSIRFGRKKAFFTVLGIVSGTAVWVVSGFMGITLLFRIAPWIYTSIKIAGAAYLIYTGISRILIKDSNRAEPKTPELSALGHFRKGLIVNLTNPKTAIFISSLFASAVPEDVNTGIGIVSVATVIVISFLWYSMVASVFSAGRLRNITQRKMNVLSRVSAAVFFLLGIKILVSVSKDRYALSS